MNYVKSKEELVNNSNQPLIGNQCKNESESKTQTLIFNDTTYQFSPYYPNGEEHYGIYINGELEPTYLLHPYSLEKWGVQYRLCSKCGYLSYTLNTIYFCEVLSFQNITECIGEIKKFESNNGGGENQNQQLTTTLN